MTRTAESLYRKLTIAGAASLAAVSLAASGPALGQVAPPPRPAPTPAAPPGVVEIVGKLANGTRYTLQRPAKWNGVLVLNPDLAEGRAAGFNNALLKLGYATGNRARDVTNWQVRDGATDLVQLKTLFIDRFSRPTRTIIIGGSLGGLVTRDAGETYPQEFQGVIPTCGGGAGLIGMYNNRLDVAFALKTLLAPDDAAIELDHIKDDRRSGVAMKAAVDKALTTPQGRARLALIAAIGQISGWPTNTEPPAAGDYDSQLKAMGEAIAIIQTLKSDVEKAAGGAFSWNTGVDYAAMFRQADRSTVAMAEALYRQAGLDLNSDLAALQAAPRLQADPEALAWARSNGVPSGKLQSPTLVLFTAVDPRAPLSEYRAYQTAIDAAGRGALLRQAGVWRSGHCNFQTSERVAAVTLMDERLRTGRWPAVTPAALNARAQALDTQLGGLGAPRFSDFPDTPSYTRPFGFADRAPQSAVKR